MAIFDAEESQIRDAYAKRPSQDARYSWFNAAYLFSEQDFERCCLRLLQKQLGNRPLEGLKILEVGCGKGIRLRQLIRWGVGPDKMSGLDLLPDHLAGGKSFLWLTHATLWRSHGP